MTTADNLFFLPSFFGALRNPPTQFPYVARGPRAADRQCYTGRDDSSDARFMDPAAPAESDSGGAGLGLGSEKLGRRQRTQQTANSVLAIY